MDMADRYRVTDPVDGGYAYFDVIEPESNIMPNFAVATIWKGMPNARNEAYALCARLNGAKPHLDPPIPLGR